MLISKQMDLLPVHYKHQKQHFVDRPLSTAFCRAIQAQKSKSHVQWLKHRAEVYTNKKTKVQSDTALEHIFTISTLLINNEIDGKNDVCVGIASFSHFKTKSLMNIEMHQREFTCKIGS
jgi:hypothetical protein